MIRFAVVALLVVVGSSIFAYGATQSVIKSKSKRAEEPSLKLERLLEVSRWLLWASAIIAIVVALSLLGRFALSR